MPAPSRALAATVMLVFGVAACTATPGAAPAPETGPEERAARIETTGCGFAADRTGSGVAIADGRVVTVAHLVAQAGSVRATIDGAQPVGAEIVAVDRALDLALLRVPPTSVGAVETAAAGVGEQGRIVGGAASGTVAYRVEQVASLSIEEVLGTERHSRRGYELEARTATGDSGAGAYDEAGRLIGIVFAISAAEDDATWVTASAEIDRFLAAADGAPPPKPCE